MERRERREERMRRGSRLLTQKGRYNNPNGRILQYRLRVVFLGNDAVEELPARYKLHHNVQLVRSVKHCSDAHESTYIALSQCKQGKANTRH